MKYCWSSSILKLFCVHSGGGINVDVIAIATTPEAVVAADVELGIADIV